MTPQCLEALACANETRRLRTHTKAIVASAPPGQAREHVATLLSHRPGHLATATVGEVLAWLPGVGPLAVQRILDQAQDDPRFPISETRRIRELTDRQAARLIDVLTPTEEEHRG